MQSVCEQSGMEIEVLLIDDASDDGSGDLCDKLANEYPNVRVFHTEKGGLSVARNIGIKNAQGDYVAFLDSDDCWLPIHDWSQIMAKMQEQNEVIFLMWCINTRVRCSFRSRCGCFRIRPKAIYLQLSSPKINCIRVLAFNFCNVSF